MKPFFVQTEGEGLAQGDILTGCPVPLFPPDFGTGEGLQNVPFQRGTLIVVTQSCDLENKKAPLVALCPVYDLSQVASLKQGLSQPKELDRLRKGDYVALHMLASPEEPENNLRALVVDFRQLYSLPFPFLSGHAVSLGKRWRLDSPFLEHFSQAFARFFMRVGLPSSIPPFVKK